MANITKQTLANVELMDRYFEAEPELLEFTEKLKGLSKEEVIKLITEELERTEKQTR